MTDFCKHCGWWDEEASLEKCAQCKEVCCWECRDMLGLCCDCLEWTFPRGTEVIQRTELPTDLIMSCHVWPSVGKHYWLNVTTADTSIFDYRKQCSSYPAAAKTLVAIVKKRHSPRVHFYECNGFKREFYKNKKLVVEN